MEMLLRERRVTKKDGWQRERRVAKREMNSKK
jgi:hypothetical protein